MGEIGVFIYVTVDGFFAGPNGEIDWFKAIQKDDELEAFTHGQSKAGGTLILGRTTYEMMKSYWPTPDAIKSDPDMARAVNHNPKIVFSKTMQSVEEGPEWKNVTLLHEIEREEIVKLKERSDKGFTILGSGSIVRQFANLGLIDEYQIIIAPLVLGTGKYLFEGVGETSLKLLDSKGFKNGIVMLRYQSSNA